MRIIQPCSLLLAAMSLLAPAAHAQAFEGTLDVRSATMPPAAGMQYFIKGNRIRLEITAEGQPPIVMISDGTAKKQYVVFDDQKAYTSTTFAEVARSTDSLRKRSERLLQGGSMTPLGTTAVIAGHTCAMHRYRDAESVHDICLTTDLGALGGLGGLFGNVGQNTDGTEPPPWAQKFLKAGSFALRLADTSGNMIWEVRKVVAQALAPALFTPPSGYSDMGNPGEGAKPPAQH